MIEEKLSQLKEDYEKVSGELEKFSQIRLKILGAIEILESMKKDEEKPKEDKPKKEKE